MLSTAEPHIKYEQWEEESLYREGEGYTSEAGGADSGDNLHRPVDFTPNNDPGNGHGPPPPLPPHHS